jgi:hypothetical protein
VYNLLLEREWLCWVEGSHELRHVGGNLLLLLLLLLMLFIFCQKTAYLERKWLCWVKGSHELRHVGGNLLRAWQHACSMHRHHLQSIEHSFNYTCW